MDEEKKTESTSEGSTEGVHAEAVSEIDRADQIAERQKRENDRREALLIRGEALEARKTIGGRSEGASTEEVKVETNQEYVDKLRANGWRADG